MHKSTCVCVFSVSVCVFTHLCALMHVSMCVHVCMSHVCDFRQIYATNQRRRLDAAGGMVPVEPQQQMVNTGMAALG